MQEMNFLNSKTQFEKKNYVRNKNEFVLYNKSYFNSNETTI